MFLSARRRVRSLLACCVAAAFSMAAFAPPAVAGDRADLPVRELQHAVRSRTVRPAERAWLGVVSVPDDGGLRISSVVAGSPAERSALAAGDVIRTIAGAPVTSLADLDAALDARSPGESVDVVFVRGGRGWKVTPTLGGQRRADGLFTGPVFRLAVVPLRFAGERAPDGARLRSLLFGASSGGTLADYYRDQSYDRLAVTGDVLDPVDLPGARTDYSEQPMGATDRSAFAAAARALASRMSAASAAQYHGIAFVHAGAPETRPGFALWPHRAQVVVHGRKVSYYVHAAEGPDGAAVGVHCHEFGHLLGLADAYGTGHRTGSGDFCLMALGHRGGPSHGAARPFALCGPCRASLGWADEILVEPTVPQRIRIRPMETARGAVAVVPCAPDGSERLVLEVRARRGASAEMPCEGLLVWRIGGRPTPGSAGYATERDLVEAHGVDVLDASLVRTGEIAFPNARARDLTPHTVPASTHADGPSSPYLTDIVREPDGSVVLTLGVRRRVTQGPPPATPADVPGPDGFIVRTDPITGETVRFWPGGGSGSPLPATSGQRR